MVVQRRGTRPCPFCGERIKAVAIRCRFCHSDIEPLVAQQAAPKDSETEIAEEVPEVVAEEATEDFAGKGDEEGGDEEGGDEKGAEEVADEQADAPESPAELDSPSRLDSAGLTRVLASAAVLAAVAAAFLGWRVLDQPSAVELGGADLTENQRTEILVAATDLAQRTLSYNFDTFDQDRETATAKMTEAFRADYNDTMDQVEVNTIENEISLQALSAASSIISANEDHAEVLIFANQTSTAKSSEEAQLNRSSLIVTLERDGEDWLLSDLKAVR